MGRSDGLVDKVYESEFAERRKLHRGDYTIGLVALKAGFRLRGIVQKMGRCLLLADVHANLCALEAVMDDARRHGGFDCVFVLGDIVGYGPQPDECIERLREEVLVSVAGNHDLGVVGRASLARFNPDAAAVCLWSRSRLSASSIGFLRALPVRHRESPFMFVHGSARDPVWEYVTSQSQALTLAPFCEELHCVVGHTHCQSVFGIDEASASCAGACSMERELILRGRLLINPGSVGQPRDGDPRAAYAIYDTDADTVCFRRVVYDVHRTADLMLSLGLPVLLARRLHAGY